MGLFCCDEKALEHILQHEHRLARQQDSAVNDAVLQHGTLCAQKHGDGAQEQQPQHGKNDASADGHIDKHGKVTLGPAAVPFTKGTGHKSAAAGADHEAKRAQDHQQRENQVHGRKSRFAHKIAHKQAVHNAVNGGKDHHDDGRRHKAQQLSRGEVVG